MPLTPSVLAEIVNNAVNKVKESRVFAASLRNGFSAYRYVQLEEGTAEFSEMKVLYDSYLKSGNTEKFYGRFYSLVPLKSTSFFPGLSRNAATLLATKVADCMLVHCRHIKSPDGSVSPSKTMLSDKEKAGLQYLGGYVLHSLYKKCARMSTSESHQAMVLLKAGKLQDKYDKQKLVSSLNRGGLWAVTGHAYNVFSKTEHHFRQLTSNTTGRLQRVDITSITHKSITDSYLISSFQNMVSDAELVPTSCVSKDVLHSIVKLYVRVRAFSFAKDIIQQHKMKLKQTKGKALRKDIKRSCEEQTQQRQN